MKADLIDALHTGLIVLFVIVILLVLNGTLHGPKDSLTAPRLTPPTDGTRFSTK